MTVVKLKSSSFSSSSAVFYRELHSSLCTLSNNRAVLQWLPAHVGIAGNETSDRLAKAAAKLPKPHLIQRSQDPSETEALISLEDSNHHLPSAYQQLWAKKTSEEIRSRSCWFSPLWMWAHSSDLPTPGDSTPTVLAKDTVKVGTKLWGQTAELQQTTGFLAATGLRI